MSMAPAPRTSEGLNDELVWTCARADPGPCVGLRCVERAGDMLMHEGVEYAPDEGTEGGPPGRAECGTGSTWLGC